MSEPHAVGDAVQTPLGKGVVLDVRSRGRLLVDLSGRKVVFEAGVVTPLTPTGRSSRRRQSRVEGSSPVEGDTPAGRPLAAPIDIDLHGLTVAEAIAEVGRVINDALVAGRRQVRLIHGRSGGKLRHAVQQQLRSLPPVRAFRLDPRNEGVTIVEL